MIIRDAVEADLPAIVEIYNATVPTRMVTAELEPTTVEARLPWFREHSPEQYPFWVAELEGRVIAWLDFKKFLPRCAYRGTAVAVGERGLCCDAIGRNQDGPAQVLPADTAQERRGDAGKNRRGSMGTAGGAGQGSSHG